jgi:ketosteroid isomerase-like protein
MRDTSPDALLDRLVTATNARDLEGIVGCFAPDYRNETPAHPSRGFVGQEQVRRNWQQILGALPDLHVEVTARAVTGSTVWSEWVHAGTRPDGSAHRMKGVIIMEVDAGRASSARFYLEPVEGDAGSVDNAVRRQVDGRTR